MERQSTSGLIDQFHEMAVEYKGHSKGLCVLNSFDAL